MAEGVVYFVAVRTEDPQEGREVTAAMEALNEAGVLPRPPFPEGNLAVAWYRPLGDLSADDHLHLEALGLEPNVAHRIASSASSEQEDR
jgi:hypothetical protein